MSQFFTPRNLMRIIWRRLPAMILVLMIGLPLAAYYVINQPRLYEAIAVIQIESAQVVQTGAQGIAASNGPDQQLDLIQQKLGSRDSMAAVIEELNLFEQEPSPNERVGLLRGAVEITKLIDPTQAFRPDATPSGLIITVRMGDPDEAAAVANHFLNAIVTEAAERASERAQITLDFFIEQEDRVNAEILAAEQEIASFKLANAGSLPTDVVAQRDILNTLREQRLVLDQQLIEVRSGSERLREDAERQARLLEEQLAFLQADIDDIEAALAAAPDVERQLSSLERRLEQLETEYTAITNNRTEAAVRERLESQDQAQRFEILETAIPPEFSISSSRTRLALMGGFAVGMLALLVGFLLEVSRPVIRNASQLESQLGIQAVITVPHLSGRVQRRRQLAGVVALIMGIVAIPAWFLFGFRDVAQRLFGGSTPASQ